jgi:hypothetical protein
MRFKWSAPAGRSRSERDKCGCRQADQAWGGSERRAYRCRGRGVPYIVNEMTGTLLPGGPPPPWPREVEFLWKEYELLQGKVDKIGAFKFQIRGWSVTLLSALFVTSYRQGAQVPLVAGVALILGFWLTEWYETVIGRAVQDRAEVVQDLARILTSGALFVARRRTALLAPARRRSAASVGEAIRNRKNDMNWLSALLFRGAGHLFYVLQLAIIGGALLIAPPRAHATSAFQYTTSCEPSRNTAELRGSVERAP